MALEPPAWRIGMALVAVVLTGCTPWVAQPDDPPAVSADIHAIRPGDIQGFWEARGGDIGISEWAVGQIYNYDWYAIEHTSTTTAVVVWDNGMSCGRTPALVAGNIVQLTVDTVTTTFVMHDAHTATVTFHQGARTWVKQLEKTRADPTVVCM